MSTAAILLAAARDAAGAPIALLRWHDDLTLVEYQVAQLQLAGVRDIEVVLAPDGAVVIPFVSGDNVEPIIDPIGDEASAVRVGTSAVPRGTTEAIITRIDEPRPAAVYARLIDAHTPSTSVTRPIIEGERGTPVVVNERALESLRNVRDAEGLARLVDSTLTTEVPFDTDIVLLRVASPDDCARAGERYAL